MNENDKKPSFEPDFGPFGPKIWLSPCTISEKTNDLVLRKLSDRRADGWTCGRAGGRVDARMDRQRK